MACAVLGIRGASKKHIHINVYVCKYRYRYIYIYNKYMINWMKSLRFAQLLGEPWFECFSPPDRKGLLDFMLESTFAMLLHHAPTQYPARAALQWIPPSIPPEQLVSGSRRVCRQSCLPVDPAQYPARAARQWIPPSIPPERLASGSRLPERLASGSRRVFCQRGSPVDPAEYPARVARQWIPHSSSPVDPAEYPLSIPHSSSPSIPLSIPCQWILPSILPVSSRSGSPLFASGSRQCPARKARQSGFA